MQWHILQEYEHNSSIIYYSYRDKILCNNFLCNMEETSLERYMNNYGKKWIKKL